MAFVFAVAAADWMSGIVIAATMWRWRRWRRGRRPADRADPYTFTPLADEVEAWLRHQG